MTAMVSIVVHSISGDSRYGVSDGAIVVMTEIVPVMAHSNSGHKWSIPTIVIADMVPVMAHSNSGHDDQEVRKGP